MCLNFPYICAEKSLCNTKYFNDKFMKRVRNFCVSAILSIACVGYLTAQDSLLLSGLSCSFAGNASCSVHCVSMCKKVVGSSNPNNIFALVPVSRLPMVAFDTENLCICKMLKLVSYSKQSTLKCVSAASFGYLLKSNVAPFGSSLMTNGFYGLAYMDSYSARAYKKR